MEQDTTMKLNERIGITENEFSILINIISKFENVEKGVVYGSRAKGTHKPFSDVDLTLEGENLSSDDILHIADMLEESPLPYLFDLSNFNTLTNQNLISHIERCGIIIFQR